MYNRYQGNSGRVTRVEDGRGGGARYMPPGGAAPPPRGPGGSLLDSLGGILPKKLEGFETEDLMLLLILYLLYRDSGDKELLIIMGAMFLL
jgi:hypothetical protein